MAEGQPKMMKFYPSGGEVVAQTADDLVRFGISMPDSVVAAQFGVQEGRRYAELRRNGGATPKEVFNATTYHGIPDPRQMDYFFDQFEDPKDMFPKVT